MRVPSIGGDRHLYQLSGSILNLIPFPLLLSGAKHTGIQARPLTLHFWNFKPGYEGLRVGREG